MFIDYDTFRSRADALTALMGEACRTAGRATDSVVLLPVTKTHPVTAAEYVTRYGLPAVGENRMQELVEKRSQLATPLRWELIGHLQSNKAKLAALHCHRVQSADSEKLLRILNQAAGELGQTLSVLLQINAGHDPAKFGAEPTDAPRLMDAALACSHLHVDGLMTIAPLGATPDETATLARRTFANLRTIRDDLARRSGRPLRELSMGMTGDYAAAIAEGSTMIRVGTALFGQR